MAIVIAAAGMCGAAAMNSAEMARLNGVAAAHEQSLEATRRDAQREINALAARMGELQAQANRLNALGDRLARGAGLEGGEFDFDRPVGIGGPEAASDMPARRLLQGLDTLDGDLANSGQQLSVLEALLFDRTLERNAMPSRSPVASSFVTSSYGYRADPFGRGGQFHKGIDFDARTGDPVMTVADGVVSYSGVRGGYGNVVEVDHGNGYVTRYAHNSRNLAKVGDLVRVGDEIAKAGSTGRSTGAHVHFEVWENGRVQNPRKFLGDMGVSRQ
ncbi:M23 family metallopeptidase [Luteimonas sp BLCC-B24]|uniref:M23 family metallopeptidase n=1 Tax=Luteimonas sp. BLCC-B24 TaxID=3025317 RepID=UPI00234DF38C|nr:M23 family metallopeptidase [Luteimonas sp. BLCC-B24]MDC7807774.1 M23 family metallopeptidase [Luteimonas sp. BLCC-B24]